MAIDWNKIKNNLEEITKQEDQEQIEPNRKEKPTPKNKEKKPFTKMVFAKSKKKK